MSNSMLRFFLILLVKTVVLYILTLLISVRLLDEICDLCFFLSSLIYRERKKERV
ncbi:hypothetical protein BD560DRAFT_385844 [Blakeslea trispora]|nr:hypothetical protein BD560DRAFT_385844 [Blakeslea trispora]